MKTAIVISWSAFVLSAAGLILALVFISNQPSIDYIYEDGAGILSDSRSFCIKGELCDD